MTYQEYKERIYGLWHAWDVGWLTVNELYLCRDEVDSLYDGRMSQRQKMLELAPVLGMDNVQYLTDFYLDYIYHKFKRNEDISEATKHIYVRKKDAMHAEYLRRRNFNFSKLFPVLN